MKPAFLLFLLIALSCHAMDLLLPDGTKLTNLGKVTFDGASFVIENDNGIAHVPWSKMPPAWQAKAKPLDAEEMAQKEARRKQVLAKEAAANEAEYAEQQRLLRLPKALVLGKIIQKNADGYRVVHENYDKKPEVYVKFSDDWPVVAPDVEIMQGVIWVPREKWNEKWFTNEQIAILGRKDGSKTYTSEAGEEITLPIVSHPFPKPQGYTPAFAETVKDTYPKNWWIGR